MSNLFDSAAECLAVCEPSQKAQLTHSLYKAWCDGKLSVLNNEQPLAIGEAGRPDRPELVAPRDVPKRSMQTPQGRVVLCHALAHIEFNAINLALDAIYRFRDMPESFYGDWLKVASEEAYHFSLLESYLNQHECEYGDYVAHDGLWHMAQITAHDVMVRMALVPRVLEARGLDVTPGIIQKLRQAKDNELIAHLEVIHRDEIGHVATGSHWFKYICEQRKLDYRTTFKDLVRQYMKGKLRGPFDDVARMQAGFSAEEIADLNALEI
ncbi:MAG TPA: ferritin-like domain-containing protein [Gammaproteobacteria bacterium]|nr:ferritin-like domain-containing protein [Gammaproteobacteria bacterium]